MVKDFDKFEKALGVLERDFFKGSEVEESVILGSDFYKSEKDKLLLEHFKINKLRIHIELFCRLSALLGRKKFLEMGGGTF